MPNAPTHLERLIGLAKEHSSDQRRELLREVTDLFMDDPKSLSPTELEYFGEIMGRVASELELEVRKELSQKLSVVPIAPQALVAQLALDDISVAAPLLRKSFVLQDNHLINVASTQSDDHLLAMTERDSLSEAVGDAIVARASDRVLVSLACNPNAEISRSSMETMVDRAHKNKQLHEPLVTREGVPPDLLNEMYFIVSSRLRNHILKCNAKVNEAELDEALRKSRERLNRKAESAACVKSPAQQVIDQLERNNDLKERTLVTLLKRRQYNEFVLGFARLADMDIKTTQKIMFDRTCDALAIACRAIGFEQSTFAAFVFDTEFVARRDQATTREIINLYSKLPLAAAQRTLRFWRIRRQSVDDEDQETQSEAATAA